MSRSGCLLQLANERDERSKELAKLGDVKMINFGCVIRARRAGFAIKSSQLSEILGRVGLGLIWNVTQMSSDSRSANLRPCWVSLFHVPAASTTIGGWSSGISIGSIVAIC